MSTSCASSNEIIMNKHSMLLLVAGTIAAATAPAVATDLRPMVVTNLTGTLHIMQPIPCNGTINQTTPVTGGRLQLTPAEGLDVTSGKRFALTRADVFFANFSVTGSCAGISDTRSFTQVAVQLGHIASFTAVPAGADVFSVTIPRDDFSVYQSAFVNGVPESDLTTPSQDVTGTIDLANGVVSFLVTIPTRVRFQAGCVPEVGCAIDETKDGALTAIIAGTIAFPDTDADTVPDRTDNCRFVANPDQSPVATPAIAAAEDVTLASCVDHAIGFATAADRCDAEPVTVTNNAPATFVVGPNLVTWTAQDSQSRVATAGQTVTVVDTTAPIFTLVPPDVTVNNCGAVTLGAPAADDDCAGTPTFTNNAPAFFQVGATPVVWTARDASGNTTTATQMVTVNDQTLPAIACVPAGPPGGTFQVSTSDACAGAPTIRIGSYVLANGERIKIQETGTPGVRLINVVGSDLIRHFDVGKGEAVITATDTSGNVATVTCQY
jgi:hypothetical protein